MKKIHMLFAAAMAAKELVDYIENGNIKNSVNFPNAEMNAVGSKICILHKNVPSVIASLTTAISNAGGNIENMVNKSRKDMSVTVMEMEELPSKERTAILLFYLKGYAIREIAGILDATEDAVKKQLSRGRDKLKTLLKDE